MPTTSLKRWIVTALFAAMICLTTAYLFHIPVGTAGGYIHLGDAFIYLAAAFLPTPYAMAAAGIGAGLADILSGVPHWAVFTVVIKAAMALCLTAKTPRIVCVRNVLGSVLAGVVCIVGYYVAEVILFGNWISPLLSTLTGGVAQAVGGTVVFVLCGLFLDKADVRGRLNRM
ncbi:MAG: TIGR04002 family protein [Clostridia bacterium]|nr:TIGR04002 family protein [Clostridia bacterium]